MINKLLRSILLEYPTNYKNLIEFVGSELEFPEQEFPFETYRQAWIEIVDGTCSMIKSAREGELTSCTYDLAKRTELKIDLIGDQISSLEQKINIRDRSPSSNEEKIEKDIEGTIRSLFDLDTLRSYMKPDKQKLLRLEPTLLKENPATVMEYIINLDEASFDVNNLESYYSMHLIHDKTEVKEIIYENMQNHLKFSIHKPKLLLPCNVTMVEDDLHDRTCPLHGAAQTEIIEKFLDVFSNNIGTISFSNPARSPPDKLDLLFLNTKENYLWPPTIDSFLFTQYLEELKLNQQDCKHVLDLGCGTGYLGFWAWNHFDTIESITFVDYILSPLLFTKLNVLKNRDMLKKYDSVRQYYHCGDGFNWMHPLKDKFEPEIYDLLIINPPYLPTKLPTGEYPDLERSTSVSGLDLLKNTLKFGKNYARKVAMVFSSISEVYIRDLLDETCVVKSGISLPYRTTSSTAIQNEYIEDLLRDGGLIYDEDNPFPYQHELYFYVK